MPLYKGHNRNVYSLQTEDIKGAKPYYHQKYERRIAKSPLDCYSVNPLGKHDGALKSFGPALPPSKFLRDTLATEDIIEKDPIYMKKHIKTRDVFKTREIEGACPAQQARNPRLRKNNDYIIYIDVSDEKPRFQKQ